MPKLLPFMLVFFCILLAVFGSAVCTDSDNGKDITRLGTCQDSKGIYTDRCENRIMVREFFCCPAGPCPGLTAGGGECYYDVLEVEPFGYSSCEGGVAVGGGNSGTTPTTLPGGVTSSSINNEPPDNDGTPGDGDTNTPNEDNICFTSPSSRDECKRLYGHYSMECFRAQNEVGCKRWDSVIPIKKDYGAFYPNDKYLGLKCQDNFQVFCLIGLWCGEFKDYPEYADCKSKCEGSDEGCVGPAKSELGDYGYCVYLPSDTNCTLADGSSGKCDGKGKCISSTRPPNCGNGVIDGGEECDGNNLHGKTCADLINGSTGTLACKDNCTFDTSGCIGGGGGGGVPPVQQCTNEGEIRCSGLAKQACLNVNGTLQWKTLEDPSEECCKDGDCSSSKCSAARGAWLPGAPQSDIRRNNNYCCGDDNTTDLGAGIVFSGKDYMCVDDGGYKWIEGVEGKRYVSNRVLYCSGDFFICGNAAPYPAALAKHHCTLLCGFYCEPQFDKWLNSTNPEGLNILSEPLKRGERIDSKKVSLNASGNYGCCPRQWCWNGAQCIENQADESGNLYVYSGSGNTPHRCIDGTWKEARLVYSWDYKLRGYCPDKDNQCLVSYDNASKNNQPIEYFSDSKPQCIEEGQYILDYLCNGYEWASRTSLVANKMIQLAGSDSKFRLFCGPHREVLNNLDYRVAGKPASAYLGRECTIKGQKVPCANNACVLKELPNGRVLFGISLNVGLFNGIHNLFNISSCPPQTEDVDFVNCGNNLIYNSELQIPIYSRNGISTQSRMESWEFLLLLLKRPIATISELIRTGKLQYYGQAGIPLRFAVLNQTPLFSRLYIANYGAGKQVQGVFEEGKFDWGENKTKYYLLVRYSGINGDVCAEVNDYTKGAGRTNCAVYSGEYIVADTRDMPSDLMERWTDLTSKFRP